MSAPPILYHSQLNSLPKQNITTPGSISVHHVLLADPLELHTSLAHSHTLSYQHSLHTKELIGHPAVQDWCY